MYYENGENNPRGEFILRDKRIISPINYVVPKIRRKKVIIRDYKVNDEIGWVRCRTLAFLQTAYLDRKSTRLNSSHVAISYAVFCLKKKNKINHYNMMHMHR